MFEKLPTRYFQKQAPCWALRQPSRRGEPRVLKNDSVRTYTPIYTRYIAPTPVQTQKRFYRFFGVSLAQDLLWNLLQFRIFPVVLLISLRLYPARDVTLHCSGSSIPAPVCGSQQYIPALTLLGPQPRFGDNWGQITWNLSGVSPKRDWSSKMVK